MSLEGKLALITGGGRGIGRAIAERFTEGGARVVVTGRTQTEIDEVAAATRGFALRMDVTDRASIAAGLDELHARELHVDVLVNNAGASDSTPFDSTTDEVWDRMLSVNVTSAFLLCRALIPPMISRGFGRVINIASNAGLTGFAYSTAYCAAKHAMVGMTRAIAAEIARSQVTINCVCPGWVKTRMAEEAVSRLAEKTGRGHEDATRTIEAMSPQQRMVEPSEVAHVAAMLCSPEARGIHGQAIAVDGGVVLS